MRPLDKEKEREKDECIYKVIEKRERIIAPREDSPQWMTPYGGSN